MTNCWRQSQQPLESYLKSSTITASPSWIETPVVIATTIATTTTTDNNNNNNNISGQHHHQHEHTMASELKEDNSLSCSSDISSIYYSSVNNCSHDRLKNTSSSPNSTSTTSRFEDLSSSSSSSSTSSTSTSTSTTSSLSSKSSLSSTSSSLSLLSLLVGYSINLSSPDCLRSPVAGPSTRESSGQLSATGGRRPMAYLVCFVLVVASIHPPSAHGRSVGTCRGVPCANGGMMRAPTSAYGHCRCMCPPRFVGPYCRTELEYNKRSVTEGRLAILRQQLERLSNRTRLVNLMRLANASASTSRSSSSFHPARATPEHDATTPHVDTLASDPSGRAVL